jgi:hypothetical protein
MSRMSELIVGHNVKDKHLTAWTEQFGGRLAEGESLRALISRYTGA